MPKSKHRKQPFRTQVEQRRRENVLDDRALPENQEYPPALIPRGDLMTPERLSRISRIKAEADERRGRRLSRRTQPLLKAA
jgi:hypothetical protein